MTSHDAHNNHAWFHHTGEAKRGRERRGPKSAAGMEILSVMSAIVCFQGKGWQTKQSLAGRPDEQSIKFHILVPFEYFVGTTQAHGKDFF